MNNNRAAELERRLKNNPQGYQVNINHPEIRPIYQRYKRWKGIPPNSPLSDQERFEFEEYYIKAVEKEAKKSMQKSKTPRVVNQIRGMRNNAQGHIFEDNIKKACQIYQAQGRAAVDKTPEPFRVLRKNPDGVFTGRFTALAQPDFQGTLNNGQSIVFEAKYTTADRIQRNVLTQEQRETLEAHHLMGAQTAVVCGIQSNFFRVPWVIWRDMKQIYGRQYLTATDVERYRIKFDGAVRFLDYIHSGKEGINIGNTAESEKN